MDKIRIKSPPKQIEAASKPGNVTRDGKRKPKAIADRALGKGRSALGSNKDKLSNDFST